MCSWLLSSCEIDERSTCISWALPLALLRPPLQGRKNWARVVSDIRGKKREMRRTRHSLSRGGDTKGRGYTRWNVILCTSLFRSGFRGRHEEYAMWKMAPITGWTPADLCCWPPQPIGVTSLQCLNLLTHCTHKQACVSCATNCHPGPVFSLPRVLLH